MDATMLFRNTFLLVLVNFSLIQGMQQDSKTVVPAALTKWPITLYAQAFPGKEQTFVKSGDLEKIKRIAVSGTKEKAVKLAEETKEVYDWVFALTWAEEHLLNKPFETWTIDDLCGLNACLTRLTETTEGKFRDGSAFWQLKVFHDQELVRFNYIVTLMQQGKTPSQELQNWFHQVNHCFPPSREIPELMRMMLTQAQSEFKKYKNEGKVDIQKLVKIATWYHFQLVGIHPWQGANKRTGRLVMYLILAQCGVKIRHIPNFDHYVDCFVKNMVKPNAVPLGELIYSLVEK